MKKDGKILEIIAILLLVLVCLIVYVVVTKEKRERIIYNDKKCGYKVTIIDKVPGIIYDEKEFYYDKGYKFIEKDGEWYLFISGGVKKDKNNYIKIKRIDIEDNNLTIKLVGEDEGKGKDRIGGMSRAVIFNKKPQNITIEGIHGEKYDEIKYINIPYLSLIAISKGKGKELANEGLRILEDAFEKYDLNIAIVYKGDIYEGLFGVSSIIEEIDVKKNYNTKIKTEDNKDIIYIDEEK